MEEEQVLLSSPRKVMRRIKNYWSTRKPFSASHYRGLVMGLDMHAIFTQLTVYILVQQSVKAGHMPYWTTDAGIVLVAAISALFTPFFSWLGFRRRRRTMTAWLIVSLLTIILVCFTSYIPNIETEFCQNSLHRGVSAPPMIRLVLLSIIVVVVTVSSNATWCHGVAYINENAPDTITEYGILVCAKVLAYSLAYTFVIRPLESGRMWLQMLFLNGANIFTLVQLLKAPIEIEHIGFDKQGFLASIGRVVGNKLVMSQIASLALLTAGFWGSAYYRLDIVKAKFLFVEPQDDFMFTYTSILYYHFLILTVCYFGLKYNKPLMAVFNQQSALKMTTFLAASLFLMYIAISFVTCQKGAIAGLSGNEFVRPQCSIDCTCSKQLELNPVCVFDEMVTYLSPCHAGCTGRDNLHGISVVSNCTCSSGSRRAAVGACAASACSTPRSLHAAVWLFVVIFYSLAAMLQLASVLRGVAVRDGGAALGVGLCAAAALAPGAAHLLYTALAYNTCAWANNGVCKLQNSKFPDITYYISGAFSMAAALVSFTTFLLLRKSGSSKEPFHDEPIDLGSSTGAIGD